MMKKHTVRLAFFSCLVLLAAVPTGVYAAGPNPYIQAKFTATTGSLGPWTSVSGEAGGEAHYVPIGQQIDFVDESGVINPMPDGQNQPNPGGITKREWCKDSGAWIELPQGTVTWTYAAAELGDFIIKERVWANTTPNNAICSMKFTPVEVVQDNDLWWFNGANAANYHEEVTLTAQGATTGTFKWEVTAGADKVDLNNGGADADTITATDDNTVQVKSTGVSAAVNDVSVKLSINGAVICTHTMTVYAPQVEVQTGVTDHNFSYMGHNNGYESRHNFQINDQFSNALPHNIELNEHWTEGAQNDHTPATNWTQANDDSWVVNPAGDIDYLRACWWGTAVPNTTNPANPLGATEVYHWDGEHYVGTATEGSGVRVLTRVWQYYQDHGRRIE